jgi:hypothetical protein
MIKLRIAPRPGASQCCLFIKCVRNEVFLTHLFSSIKKIAGCFAIYALGLPHPEQNLPVLSA